VLGGDRKLWQVLFRHIIIYRAGVHLVVQECAMMLPPIGFFGSACTAINRATT
jgi:hypothetical protein